MEKLPSEVLWIILERAIAVVDGGNIYERWIPLYDSKNATFFRGLMVTCKTFYKCIKKNTICKPPCEILDFSRLFPIKRIYTVPRVRNASANLYRLCNSCTCCDVKKAFQSAFNGKFIFLPTKQYWVQFYIYSDDYYEKCDYFSFFTEDVRHSHHLRWNEKIPTYDELCTFIMSVLEQ